MEAFAAKLKADWDKQPLAITLTALSIVLAAVFFVIENVGFSDNEHSIPSRPWAGQSFSASIPIYLVLCPALASFSGKFLRRSFLTGVMLSLLIASLAMAAFSYVERDLMFAGAIKTANGVSSPMIDLLYWATFWLFMGICLEPMSARMVEANPVERKGVGNGTKAEGGVTNGEVLIAVFIWGLSLSAAQGKIIAFFAVSKSLPITASDTGTA